MAMPQLPLSHVSRCEIGAYADLYKDGASIPQLPGISNPQAPAPSMDRPAPSFGIIVVKTVAHHLFKNSRFTMNLVQTDPAMAAPTFSNPEGPSGFDPELQAKFPEAYAFAVRVDRFGKNQIALLKVTMQPPKPSLFKEFAWLGRLLKKGTGHDLYTPGVHTEGFQPVAIKVEAIVIEAWHNPRVQGSIQLIGGIAETAIGAGMTYASGGLAAPLGWVVMTHGLDHTITGCKAFISGEHVDSATQQLLQKSGMSHNAASTTDAALGFAGSLYGARSIGHAARGVERLATQSNVALTEQRAGAVSRPVYHSGVGFSEKNLNPIKEGVKSQEIKGIVNHAVNRAIYREVKPKEILDAIKNPLKINPIRIDHLGRPSQRFIGKSAEVVINPETKRMLSVNPTSTKKSEKLLKSLNKQ